MLDYLSTSNQLHTRLVDFTPQEYMFVLQVVLGERPEVAYASVYDIGDFKRNVPSEDEEDYLASFKQQAQILLETQNCRQLRDYLESEYQIDVQEKASNLKDYRFTGAEVQRLLNNLLHERSSELSEASVRDILALIKSMYDSGALDSGDSFQNHFITVPNKYNTICPQCNKEGYAVEGLDFRCEFCGCIAKWDESQRRYFPNLGHL
jgi:hypothetical protein